MIVSTHDLNLAAALCHDVVLLRDGRVLAHGPTAATLTAEHIRALYDVDADVQVHPRAGHVTVVPLARAR
jgi:iron complex transport system ATP-binding protein